MNHRSPLLRRLRAVSLLLALLASARAETVKPPPPIPPDHYQPIWTRSPFTLATVADDLPKGTWALVGLSQDGDGPFAILLNRQTQERMPVTGQPNGRGFSVESVDCSPDLLQSSARIKTPSETLTVRFDPSLAAAPAPAPRPGGAGPRSSPSPARPQITQTSVPRPLPKAKPPSP